MIKWLNIYFNFSRREFNGLLVMLLLLAVITVIPTVYEWIVPEQSDLVMEKAALRKLILVEKENAENFSPGKNNKTEPRGPVKLFPFDPNRMSNESWQLLGFSVKQAAVLGRYTAKGGRFRRKEDLQKMYVVSKEMYERLIPYIYVLPEEAAERPGYPLAVYPAKPKFEKVALNTADTLALTAIKGIGPAFARRIAAYRKRLGGFYKKEQLMEVYGLDSLKYKEIEDQVTIDKQVLTFLMINKAVFEDLKNHPYLTYKQVNALLQFRKQHGNYSNIADLKKVVILSDETIGKLAPYISFDHD